MNIVEAKEILRNGGKIRKKSFKKDRYLKLGGDTGRILFYYKEDLVSSDFYVDWLDADDWELYKEQSPMEEAWNELREQEPSLSKINYGRTMFEKTWNAAQKHFESK